MKKRKYQEINELRKIMKEISSVYHDVIAVKIISAYGLPIATASFDEINEGVISAMTMALISMAKRAVDEYCMGNLKQIILEGEEGKLILFQATQDYLLAILTGKEKTNVFDDFWYDKFPHDNFDKPLKI